MRLARPHRARPERIGRHLAPGKQRLRHRLQVAHPLVGPDRLPDGEDADRRVAPLDHVPEHVEVRVVGNPRLADPADGGADRRLGAVDRLALAEVELVAGGAAGRAGLPAEPDSLCVLDALAYLDNEPDRPALGAEAPRPPGEALPTPLE